MKIIDFYPSNQRLEMVRCVVREGHYGVSLACPEGGFVQDSEFLELDSYGSIQLVPVQKALSLENVWVIKKKRDDKSAM